MDINKFKLLYYKKTQPLQKNVNEYEDDSSTDTSEEEKPIDNKLIFLKGNINDYEIDFLLDTSSEISFIPEYIVEGCNITNLKDTKIMINKVLLYGKNFIVSTTSDIPIIGLDIMIQLGMIINFHTKEITFANNDYLFAFK